MKTVFYLFAFWLLGLGSVQACQSFAGKFQYLPTSPAVFLTVTQDSCKTISFSYFYPANNGTAVQSYITDGLKRRTGEDANQVIYQTSTFEKDDFVNSVEFLQKVNNSATTAISTYHLDATGNLVAIDNYYDGTGKIYSSDTRNFQKVSEQR